MQHCLTGGAALDTSAACRSRSRTVLPPATASCISLSDTAACLTGSRCSGVVKISLPNSRLWVLITVTNPPRKPSAR